MSEAEGKKEITAKDLHYAINEVTLEVIKEQREVIIRRAQAKLREKFKEISEEKKEA